MPKPMLVPGTDEFHLASITHLLPACIPVSDDLRPGLAVQCYEMLGEESMAKALGQCLEDLGFSVEVDSGCDTNPYAILDEKGQSLGENEFNKLCVLLGEYLDKSLAASKQSLEMSP